MIQDIENKIQASKIDVQGVIDAIGNPDPNALLNAMGKMVANMNIEIMAKYDSMTVQERREMMKKEVDDYKSGKTFENLRKAVEDFNNNQI